MIGLDITRIFVKNDVADDPDWTSAAQDVPPAARQVALTWGLEGRPLTIAQVHTLLLGVTLRDANGNEVAGTVDVDVLWLYPVAVSSADDDDPPRAAWKRIGRVVGHPTDEPIRQTVGGVGTLAVRLCNVSAGDHVVVSAQQWGAG